MATFNERIQVVIDVVTDKATKGFKDFRTAVSEAEGFTGKLKAGVSSLGGIFGAATSGPLAMGAAVSAAGKFAFDAAQQYATLGVEVGNFATATGLATEDASRWVEVAGDLGVGIDSLQSAIGRLNKNVDPKTFEDLGIAIAHTKDGTVDANATFLNAIERIRAIKDPTQQASIAAQLFGKGWQSLAPIINKSASDIEGRLKDVASIKVFDDKKQKQAQEFTDAMNDLNDKFQELTLTIGQDFLPVVQDSAEPLLKLAEIVQSANDKTHDFGFSLTDLAKGPMAGVEFGFGKISDAIKMWWNATDTPAIEYTGKAITNLGDSAGGSARYLGLLAEHTRDSADAASDLSGKAETARRSLKQLQDQIDGRKSFIDLQMTLKDNAQKIKDADAAFAKSKKTLEDQQTLYLNVASAALDSKSAIADYLSTFDNISETQKLEFVASLDPKSPDEMVNKIQTALDNANFYAKVAGNMAISSTTKGLMEGGIPAGNTGKSGSTNVNIHVNVAPGANPAEFGRHAVDAINAYYRAGGNRIK